MMLPRHAITSLATTLLVVVASETITPASADDNGGMAAAEASASDRQPSRTERVSVGLRGAEGTNDSRFPEVSANGRLVAFASGASNLVPHDTNDAYDVFVRDLKAHSTRRVSVGSNGEQGNGFSSANEDLAISANGRLVAFVSLASNLVPGDTNDLADLFVHDLVAGTTRRVNIGLGGAEPDDFSFDPALSANNRFVAFASWATNLVPGDTNRSPDVFVHDLRTGTTRRVSVGLGGVQGDATSWQPAISATGRLVAFESLAANLVPGDDNDRFDVFVHDLRTGSTQLISRGQGGVVGDLTSNQPAISASGRFVAFQSAATNLVPGDTNDAVDVFLHDRPTGRTWRVSIGPKGAQADGHSFDPAISPDGRFVAFTSRATNLVPDDTNEVEDVFVHDVRTGRTWRASLGEGDVQSIQGSGHAAISRNGRVVAFESPAFNLVPPDTNRSFDVFARIR